MFQHACDFQTALDNALGATDHQAAPTTGEGVSREDQSVSRLLDELTELEGRRSHARLV